MDLTARAHDVAPHWHQMGFCVSTDNRGCDRKRRMCDAVSSSANKEEAEDGWTTEKSRKGIEVLETENSSRNVLAQYLHGIFPLHFPFETFVFLRLAGRRGDLKTKTN